MPETWVRSLGWEEPLEKGKATHSSILTWRIPWTIQYMGSQRVGHDRVTFTLYSVKNLNNYKVTKSITTYSCDVECDLGGGKMAKSRIFFYQ